MENFRAVPLGYYRYLIDKMQEEKTAFFEGKFQQKIFSTKFEVPSLFVEKFDKKTQAPLICSSKSIEFRFTSNVELLENLEPIDFLRLYGKVSENRKKIIKKVHRKTMIDFEEFQQNFRDYFRDESIFKLLDEFVEFLGLSTKDSFDEKTVSVLCSYAERYFLRRNKEPIDASLRERVDFQFLKRKLDGIILKPNLEKFFRFEFSFSPTL